VTLRKTHKGTPPNLTTSKRSIAKPRTGFEFSLIDEPLLLFGDNFADTNPKSGLSAAGPAGLGSSLHPSHIRVGLIGTGATQEKAKDFLNGCKGLIAGSTDNPRQVPDFPGMNSSSVFKTELEPVESHLGRITTSDLQMVTGASSQPEGFKNAVEMLKKKVQLLCEDDAPPDVILCALPSELVDYCTEAGKKIAAAPPPKDKLFSKLLKIEQKSGQKNLLQGLFKPEAQPSDFVGRNLRRALKGGCMKWQRPIQIGLETSLFSERSQPAATKAWNLCVALYYKAGGALPWKAEALNPETCYIGVSFYRHLLDESFEMHTSLAQVFTGEGEAFVLRGHKFPWAQKKSPHLDEAGAESLLKLVLERYGELKGGVPRRIVIHKTSKFWDAELAGFRKGLNGVKEHDFLSIQQLGVRFFRSGAYPPLRGTVCEVNRKSHFLYTMGYMPELGTFPRGYVPEPWELIDHRGDNTPRQLFKELMALTKMNYNNADIADGEPITLKFARKVGEILSYIPENELPHPSYRFYM
jgi:hypothetical protein